VLALGDLQYNGASLSNFKTVYDPTWGRVKSISHPALGNHEYGTSGAGGYFDYWNGSGVTTGVAGSRGKGWYSFDVGSWHIVALNSNCSRVSCTAGSAQETWLRSDLAAHPAACTLAFWHHPRWSSGHDGDGTFMQPLWQDLYDAGAELALVGHSHDYERFAPQDASGGKSTLTGIREFVVGTGGAFFTGLGTAKPNSEVRQNNTYGVLKLTLGAAGYDWRFVAESGKLFSDSGSGACHGGSGTTPPPPPPPTGTAATFTPDADAPVKESSPSSNYATAALRTDGGGDPDVESYLRFTTAGLSGTVQSAKLRVYATTGTGNGPAVLSTSNSWSETGITWSNRPAATSSARDDKGSIASGTWVEYDVTPWVMGNGTFSFKLATTSSDGVDFYSREGTQKPQLVVTTGS
jgi:calcineurin-like phosphoesterase family protein